MASERRTVVITGSSDGIGAAAARKLAAHGNDVVIVGRSREKTLAVANELRAPHFLVDFAELESVRGLAVRLHRELERIDVLANNAGGIFGPHRVETDDGHEMTFQVDYLAPFLLTGLLIDRLIDERALVVSTSSIANRLFGRIDLDDLDSRAERFNARRAYGTAKLEQIVFTRELERRFGRRGLSSAAFHPGVIGSGFASQRGSALGWIYQNPLSHRLLGTPSDGADTLAWLAETCPSPECPSGAYFARRRVARPGRQGFNPIVGAGLWRASLEMTGLVGSAMDAPRAAGE